MLLRALTQVALPPNVVALCNTGDERITIGCASKVPPNGGCNEEQGQRVHLEASYPPLDTAGMHQETAHAAGHRCATTTPF